MMAGSKAPGLSDALARVYEVGPIIWIKRAAGACVPWKEGTAGSWSQVQLLLPRANDGNVVFSLSEAVRQRRQPVYGFEQHPPMVFVADGDSLRHHSPAKQRGREDCIQHAGPPRHRTGFTLRTYTHATRQKQDEAAQTMEASMKQVM